MGCNKVCQAKKKAAKAQRQADEAKRQADAMARSANNMSDMFGRKKYIGTTAEIITVGHLVKVHEKQNALTPQEIVSAARRAQYIPKVMDNSTTRGLSQNVIYAYNTYSEINGILNEFNIAKPAVKMAVNIGGIIFNFANIGELLGDIAMLIGGITVGFAPRYLKLMKDVFFNYPMDINVLSRYQLEQLTKIIDNSRAGMKDAFKKSVSGVNPKSAIDYNNSNYQDRKIDFSNYSNSINNYIKNNAPPYNLNNMIDIDNLRDDLASGFENGMRACKDLALQNLSEALKDFSINILEIEDVAAYDDESKQKVKEFAESLNDATKRIELAQDGELLSRQFSVSGRTPEEGQVFDDNDLALAAANKIIDNLEKELKLIEKFVTTSGVNNSNINVDDIFALTFSEEVEKKKEAVNEKREDIDAIEAAKEAIENNKGSFVTSMMDLVAKISLNLDNIISIDNCYEQAVTNEFNTLKSIILTQQTAYINSYIVNNTQDMIALKNSVFINAKQAIIDEIIIIDQECQKSFGKSICDSIDKFKRALYAEVKKSIENSTIDTSSYIIDENIDKIEYNKMLKLFMDEVKKALIKQCMDIVIEEVVPCKACKPCEDMSRDIGIYISKSIEKSKNTIIKNIESFIININRDWTITDSSSVEAQKNYLIGQLSMALQQPSGELRLVDDMMYRIKLEEDELVKNISKSLQAV